MKRANSFTATVLAVIIALTGVLVMPCAVSAVSAKKLRKAPKLTGISNTAKGVTLKWKKTSGAKGYYVYRKSGKKSYKKIAKVSKVLSYTDKKAKSGTKYTYRIKAYNSKSTSPNSKSKALLRVGTPKMTVKNGSAAVKVSWTKVKGATRYVVMSKKTGAKKYTKAYSGKNTSFADDNISSGTSYDFKVKAYIKNKSGAYCTKGTQMFLEQPNLKNVEQEMLDWEGITLRWDKVKGAKGYYIYRSPKTKNSYKKIKTITNGKTESYKDTDVVSISSYKYYVVAYNGSGKSVKSRIATEVYGYVNTETLDPMYLTISKGEVFDDVSKKLHLYAIDEMITSWVSSDSSIVKVDSKGVITGVKRGKATLTATGNYNGSVKSIDIIVTVV